MSEVKHYRLDIYESNKSGEFETYVDMKESEPSRFTYVKSSDYDDLKKERDTLKKDWEDVAGKKNLADLIEENMDLSAKLEKAEKVIEFYADGDSWGHESPSSTSYSVIDKEDMGIGEFNLNELTDDDRVGGLRARKFLEENK